MKTRVPELVTGYQIDPCSLSFWVVYPEESENIAANPSGESSTTGVTATNGTLSRTIEKQRRGVYSFKVVPTAANASIKQVAGLTANAPYAFSVDFWGIAGNQYMLRVKLTASPFTVVATKKISGIRKWTRVSMNISAPTSADYDFDVVQVNNSASPFYTDGWQIENKNHPTTYFDGDIPSIVPGANLFRWVTTAHNSSSQRDAQARTGGREYNLRDLGFNVTAISGLGTPPIENISTELFLGGSYYQRTVIKERRFTLVGNIFASSLSILMKTRSNLTQKICINPTQYDQPLLIKIKKHDQEGNVVAEANLPCYYSGGLTGNTDNDHGEQLAIEFLMTDPLIKAEGDAGYEIPWLTLTEDSTVAVLFYTDKNGIYDFVRGYPGVPSSDAITCVAVQNHNSIYVGTEDGKVYKYSGGTTWTQIGATNITANDDILSMAVDTLGNLHVGGLFTTMNAVSMSYYAKWNGSTWAAATGIVGAVTKIEVDDSGKIYLTSGTHVMYSDDYGISFADVVNLSNGNDFSDFAITEAITLTVVGGTVIYAIGTESPDYNIYSYVGREWSKIGEIDIPFSGRPVLASNRRSGEVYLGGDFSQVFNAAGTSIDAHNIARWNGANWIAMDSGLNGTVVSIFVDSINIVHVAGGFTTPYEAIPGYRGNARLIGGNALWNQGAWRQDNFVNRWGGLLDVSHLNFCAETASRLYAWSEVSTTLAYSGYVDVDVDLGIMQNIHVLFKGYSDPHHISNLLARKFVFVSGLLIPLGDEAVITLSPFGGTVKFRSKNLTESLAPYVQPASDYGIAINNTVNRFGTLSVRIWFETGDTSNYIDNYDMLSGVNITNSDNMKLYVKTTLSAGTMTYEFFKDAARTQLVATGTQAFNPWSVRINEANASGIEGYIYTTANEGNSSTIEVTFSPNPVVYFKKEYYSIGDALNDQS